VFGGTGLDRKERRQYWRRSSVSEGKIILLLTRQAANVTSAFGVGEQRFNNYRTAIRGAQHQAAKAVYRCCQKQTFAK